MLKFFSIGSKVDKGKSEPTLEESITNRVQLRRKRIAKLKEEDETINNKLFKEYFTNYRSPSDTYKKLHETKVEKNEDRI